MKKIYLSIIAFLAIANFSYGQFVFDIEVDQSFDHDTVTFPPSPLKFQVLFIGGVDKVQTTGTYGKAAGSAIAKQWHDFIGFTPDTAPGSTDLGWVSVNHEMKEVNDSIGDGGGMTVFKVKRAPETNELVIVDQTLSDGRKGKFFNVDFVNFVGETGMNCGGIVGPNGQIWTAEEWWIATSDGNKDIVDRDTSDFTIGKGTATHPVKNGFPGFDGKMMKKYQNKNWMVEIDPRNAVAIRKQYNWGRQAFEGGAVTADNKTIYLTEDNTPGLFSKFVADAAGDFTKGKLYVYKHDLNDASNGNWIMMDNTNLEEMLHYRDSALARGASMFNRLEWATQIDGKIYMTETGLDNIEDKFSSWTKKGGIVSDHIVKSVVGRFPEMANKPEGDILNFVEEGKFNDYYGRVLAYDPTTDKVEIFLDGGPFFANNPELGIYPATHLSNPDGISKIKIGDKWFLIIQEDLNGTSNGRVPAGSKIKTCEIFLLDLSIVNPKVDDLIRIASVPNGAEVTGAIGTPDGKTILCNSQHPNTDNTPPYNNSLTFAITGWDKIVPVIDDITSLDDKFAQSTKFETYPNPVSRILHFNKVTDAAIYSADGKRIKVFRNAKGIDVNDLKTGTYILKTKDGEAQKVIIE